MKKMNQTLGVLALSCALVACGGNQKKAEGAFPLGYRRRMHQVQWLGRR